MERGDIDKRFTYHPPFGMQPKKYDELRSEGKRLALLIDGLCPDSREKSIAVTKLEEVIMWANASIARNETRPTEGTQQPPISER